jgi:hypothetical protein
VLLENPIKSFIIPTVRAECIFDDTADVVTYGAPEETEIIDGDSGEAVQTCRVPVVMDQKLMGYVPLPKRYATVWLELSYYIILHTNMWKLWEEEEKKAKRKAQKEKAGLLRRTTGTLVAQHMLARLLAVDELVSWSHDTDTSGQERVLALDEWKIRSSRDWFNISYEQVPSKDHKFLNADPIRPENRVLFGEFVSYGRVLGKSDSHDAEEGWNIKDEGKGLLSPPDDTAEWIDGEIDGLPEMFRDMLKPQALAALNAQNCYFETQYDEKAKLPERWHEGHDPIPHFWSAKQWDWTAMGKVPDVFSWCSSLINAYLAGNSPWHNPIDLLYFVLTQDPLYDDIAEFTRDLDGLFMLVVNEPEMEPVHELASQLWLGELTWREFGESLMKDHLHLRKAVSATSEIKGKKIVAFRVVTHIQATAFSDPDNVFNTLEARMVLEGYVRRHHLQPGSPWDVNDDILWSSLRRVNDKKYKSGWSWIISEIVLGKEIPDVLEAAGPWWKNSRSRQCLFELFIYSLT